MSIEVYQILVSVLGLAVGILGVLLWRTRRLASTRLALDAHQQQQAVLRLLDEMSSLADGDLTMRATVTEDVTGAIADAVNYAVDALRTLVMRMDMTSHRLTDFAHDAEARVNSLANSSAKQADEIGIMTAAIATMTKSIQKVSRNAASSAEVARKSLDIAQSGAHTVRATIADMVAIREKIQATSKRLKRLGESSQEISDIMRLMNDIAEQTNILALNASIQTTAQATAGHTQPHHGTVGFRRLADEMQQLAQQAAEASRKVDVLIRTMQADTSEVMASMEETTAKVVAGARSAEAAGAALDEIEDVTIGLARLIGNISEAAGKQAGMAERVGNTVHAIQAITQQTARYSEETKVLIADLNTTAADLRSAIADFNLAKEKQ
ncbi:MAG: methyl-accepting chemotaxis protein [Thiothrix sp.]